MEKKRYADFDLLRALIIISAFILHYDRRIGLDVLATPSLFISRYIFTVGGFFFFVAGYMARKVYLPKFEKDAKKTSTRVFFKGLKILLIFLSYVFLIRVFTCTNIPDNFMAFIYDHTFAMRILFTFSLLFMLTPIILYFASNHNKTFVAMAIAMFTFVFFYNKDWSISFEIKKIFIDRTLFAYPLIPALVVYAFGYMAGIVDNQFLSKISRMQLSVISVVLICAYAILWHFGFIRNWKCFTLIESITPYISVLIVRQMRSWAFVKKYIFHPNVLCVGINSLSFYVISNILLMLLHLNHHSPLTPKLISFVAIGAIAYLFTYWHNNSSLYLHSLTKRST